jgi:hypothetical protein
MRTVGEIEADALIVKTGKPNFLNTSAREGILARPAARRQGARRSPMSRRVPVPESSLEKMT